MSQMCLHSIDVSMKLKFRVGPENIETLCVMINKNAVFA